VLLATFPICRGFCYGNQRASQEVFRRHDYLVCVPGVNRGQVYQETARAVSREDSPEGEQRRRCRRYYLQWHRDSCKQRSSVVRAGGERNWLVYRTATDWLGEHQVSRWAHFGDCRPFPAQGGGDGLQPRAKPAAMRFALEGADHRCD